VDRSKLLSMTGRGRKPQMALAERMGVRHYPTPAGGCLLTDPELPAGFESSLPSHPGSRWAKSFSSRWGGIFSFPQTST